MLNLKNKWVIDLLMVSTTVAAIGSVMVLRGYPVEKQPLTPPEQEQQVPLNKDKQVAVIETTQESKKPFLATKKEKKAETKLIQKPTIMVDKKVISLTNSVDCLTANIFFEARDQSTLGMEWVAWTVKNRVGRYGNKTICDVITNSQKVKDKIVLNQCHYSWYCDQKQHYVVGKQDKPFWDKAANVAKKVIKSKQDITQGATHYHTFAVSPWWLPYDMKLIKQIDSHLFYRGW